MAPYPGCFGLLTSIAGIGRIWSAQLDENGFHSQNVDNKMLPTQRFPAPSGTRALSSCSSGAITRCGCCGDVEIAYGNAVINVDAGSFSEVRDAVHRLIGTSITTTDARPYLLVLDQPAAFAFSAEELFELAGLIEEAFEELGEEFSDGLLYAGPPPTANCDYV